MPAHRKPELHIERECPVCGINYKVSRTRLRHGRGTTCSRSCSYRLRAIRTQRQIRLSCSLCGAQFTRSPSGIKGKHGTQFCSRECHYIGRSLSLSHRIVTQPYRYTEAGRIALSQNGARAYVSGVLPYPETELAVAQALTDLGIPFVHQQVFDAPWGAFAVDFYFPDRALVLELDGERAHRGREARDAKRDALLADAGIKTIRVVDNGVPQYIRKQALRALGRA